VLFPPLTKRELDFIEWRIWEPLRRRPIYRKAYAKLKANYFTDKNAEKAFCERWKLPFALDPDCSFEELYEPRWTFGWGIYKPLFDHAVFADNAITEDGFIVGDKYLKVWIDSAASKNQIEAAFKKILDEWLKKWASFYGQKRKRRPERPATYPGIPIGDYLSLYINLEAPRYTKLKKVIGYIEPELKAFLKQELSARSRNQRLVHTFSEVWKDCFTAYDDIENGWSYMDISIKLRPGLSPPERKKHIKTLYKQYKRAKEAIHGEQSLRKDDHPCIACLEQGQVDECPCSKYEKYFKRENLKLDLSRDKRSLTVERVEKLAAKEGQIGPGSKWKGRLPGLKDYDD
jgi:hypothetical protein